MRVDSPPEAAGASVARDVSDPLAHAGPRWHAHPDPVAFRLAQALCRVACSTLFDLKVYGTHLVPQAGGVLIVSNHQSYLDPVLLGVALPRSLGYMAKSELFENPVLNWLFRSLGAFPVRQTGSAAGAIKETIERLHEGRAINIYPEGTRSPDGRIHPFEKGTALVVRKAKVPVVPAAVWGSFEAYPSGTTFPWPRPIRVMFGPPVLLHDLRPEQLTAALEGRVRAMYDRLAAMDPLGERRNRWALDRRDRERADRKRQRRAKHLDHREGP